MNQANHLLNLLAMLGFGFLAVVVAPRSYGEYVFTDLGTLGGDRSFSWGVNNLGEVVGQSRTADRQDHAFLYSSGSMTDLGSLGGHYSSANSINDQGVIVGQSEAADGSIRAFVKTAAGGLTDIDPTGIDGFAIDVNASGTVVGSNSNGSFVYSNGDLTRISSNAPAAINDNGLVATTGTNATGETAGVFNLNSGMTETFFNASPGSPFIVVWDINNRGTVVGGVFGSSVTTFRSQGGVLELIGDEFPAEGLLSNTAIGINNNGDIVGTYEALFQGRTSQRAYLLRSNGEFVDLTDATDSPILLSIATSISDNGFIAGVSEYDFSNGESGRAFLLSPTTSIPEPGTLCAIAIGTICFSIRRKRTV